jgi:hypothetical protein
MKGTKEKERPPEFSDAKKRAIDTAKKEIGRALNGSVILAQLYSANFGQSVRKEFESALAKLYEAGVSEGAVLRGHPAKAVVRQS